MTDSSRDALIETRAYFEALYPDLPDRLRILVWTAPTKLSSWCADAEDATKTVTALADTGSVNIYAGVGLAPAGIGQNQRCKADRIGGLCGLWADFDIAGPAHAKPNLPPDEAAVHQLIADLGPRPTLIVQTGHGLQAYWLFREVWIFESEAERRAAAEFARHWNQTIRSRAKVRGWEADGVSDLSRVLRVPGSTN